MRLKPLLLSVLLLPALMGAALLPALAEETYRLVSKDAVGDVDQITDDFQMSLSIIATAGGQDQKVDVDNREQQRFREEVMGVSADGHSNRVRRNYTVYRKTDGDKTQESSLQGKSVRLERKGDKLTVTSENGVIADEDKEALQNDLDGHYSKLFPNRALAVGEEWTPDNKALLQTFKGASKLTVQCKLVEIVVMQGHKAAHFHIRMDVTLPLKGGLEMEMKLEGEGYQALDIQRALSLTFDGPVTASGQETKDGMTISYAGKGMAHMKMTASWQKIAGKPIATTIIPPAS